MNKYIKILLISLPLLLTSFLTVYAQDQETKYKGTVISKEEVSCYEEDIDDQSSKCYIYQILLPDERIVSTDKMAVEKGTFLLEKGDKIFVEESESVEGGDVWYVTGIVRDTGLIILLGSFLLITFLVAGKQGLGALAGLFVSIFLIYVYAIPKFLEGQSLILTGIITAVISLVVTLYLAHGFNKKTTLALISSLFGLLFISIFTLLFMNILKVNGTGSEGAFMLMSQTVGDINLKEIFFVSILIGSVGVLDDVTVSLVSSMIEIYKANPNQKTFNLFKSVMTVGRDHVSSMVNTLFIAYAGSSLSILMIIYYNQQDLISFLNTDFVIEELLRTFASSMGILFVVPVTAYIATLLVKSKSMKIVDMT